MITWVSNNWVAILAAIVAVETALSYIVKLTPSTKDDEVLASVEKALETLGVKKP